LQPGEIPRQDLGDNVGWIGILSGEYENVTAKVPHYSKELLYHIHLEARRQFSIITNPAFEYAVFLPADNAVINGTPFPAGAFIVFNSLGDTIEINNKNDMAIDTILLGGEPYDEPIVCEGAFVMNTPHEITQAYNEYYNGKYGQVKPR